MRVTALFVCSMFVFFPFSGRSDDACTVIAKHALYDSHVTSSSTQTFQQFRSSFCGWYSRYKQTHQGGSGGASIPIADIPIGLSGSMTYGEADAMQQGLCSSQASASSDNEVWSDVSRYIDPSAANAFIECVKATRGGLIIDNHVNDDETETTVGVAYNPPMGAGPATLTRVDFTGWVCNRPANDGVDLRDYVNKTGQLTNSELGLVCERDVKSIPFTYNGQEVTAGPAMIAIFTTAGNYTEFFRAKVARDPEAETAKILAAYPKGTILPFAGRLEQIPQGWHLCDGKGGTVNLVNYIPYGAGSDAQIDAALKGIHEGNATHTHSIPDTGYPFRGFNNNVSQGDHGIVAMGNDTSFHIPDTRPASNLPPTTRVFFIEKIQ